MLPLYSFVPSLFPSVWGEWTVIVLIFFFAVVEAIDDDAGIAVFRSLAGEYC